MEGVGTPYPPLSLLLPVLILVSSVVGMDSEEEDELASEDVGVSWLTLEKKVVPSEVVCEFEGVGTGGGGEGVRDVEGEVDEEAEGDEDEGREELPVVGLTVLGDVEDAVLLKLEGSGEVVDSDREDRVEVVGMEMVSVSEIEPELELVSVSVSILEEDEGVPVLDPLVEKEDTDPVVELPTELDSTVKLVVGVSDKDPDVLPTLEVVLSLSVSALVELTLEVGGSVSPLDLLVEDEDVTLGSGVEVPTELEEEDQVSVITVDEALVGDTVEVVG